jgi:hypothetical protein
MGHSSVGTTTKHYIKYNEIGVGPEHAKNAKLVPDKPYLDYDLINKFQPPCTLKFHKHSSLIVNDDD